MKRNIRISEGLLLLGYSFILVFMVVQDWIPIGTLNDIEAINRSRSKNELIIFTLIGVIQIIILLALTARYVGNRFPLWAKLWLIIHPIFIFAGALLDWWIPYLFGYGAEERVIKYTEMFGNTHSFLPTMNGIVPNTFHTLFHTLLLLCILLTIYVSFTNSSSVKNPYSSKNHY